MRCAISFLIDARSCINSPLPMCSTPWETEFFPDELQHYHRGKNQEIDPHYKIGTEIKDAKATHLGVGADNGTSTFP